MISTSTGTRVVASPSRKISTRNKRASSWKIAYSPDELKLYAKKYRTSKGDAVHRASPSVCEDGKERISKCSKCGVMYGKIHPDPHRKEMVDRDWLCTLCSRSEDMRHAVSCVPTPRPTALQPSSKANSSPALPLPSMPVRISGGTMEAIDELPISPMFDDAENRCIADDPSVERIDKSASVGVVGVTKPVVATYSPAVPLATKGEWPGPSRGDGGIPRVVLGAGNGNRPLWVSVKRSCYCGKTDETKSTARCVYCGSVFHLQCMDPPYPTVQSLPLVGYTCLMCRPACGMCGIGVSSKSSLNITCAECKLEFHRACVSTPLSRPRKGWKCCECMLPIKPSDNADEDHPVEVEEPADPVSTMTMPEKGRRSKARGRAGSQKTVSHGVDKPVRGKPTCVVCNVAEGRRMNVCGSCGDAYHPMCLARPRARRKGESWLCDCCRTSAPVARPTSGRPPRVPGLKRSFKPAAKSNGHLLTRRTAPNVILAASTTSGGHEGPKGGGVNVLEEGRPCEPAAEGTGRWTKDEHARFLKVRLSRSTLSNGSSWQTTCERGRLFSAGRTPKSTPKNSRLVNRCTDLHLRVRHSEFECLLKQRLLWTRLRGSGAIIDRNLRAP